MHAYCSVHEHLLRIYLPSPSDHSILGTVGGRGLDTVLSSTIAQYKYVYKLR